MPAYQIFMNQLENSATETISFISLNHEALSRLSKEKLLSLSLQEMLSIQNYFRSEAREPKDIELETIAQTWSEHCKHKTFKGEILYTEESSEGKKEKVYDDLLEQTIVRATLELKKKFCLSVFEDNAGVISFDKKQAVAFKVETHNHPSALEPYGGAGTGIGGVIRDILGVGLGAKPILNTDIFCVGEFGASFSRGLEENILPPERILSGVIAGVRDYGNRMGIPTTNGAVLFHKGFFANPLVFCGTVGFLPKDKVKKKVSAGELIVSIGGKTGRDGIHGATFSSLALEKDISASVVQIGHAIMEKKAMEAILRARDQNLFSALTDCGAGGYSSSVGELASGCGAKVYLENVPLKYQGLKPWEIWLSESQERMVLSVPKENLKKLEEICLLEDVGCSVIGEFTDSGRLEVFYKCEKTCDLELNFLHKGIPKVRKKAVWKIFPQQKICEVPKINFYKNPSFLLKSLLKEPNIASKKWIIKQYDHEVQGGSVIKPFVGLRQNGPSDASVSRPDLSSWKGVVVSNGINPRFGELDPYWMAANAMDEALRNLVSVGGDLKKCAILDNFCWGDVSHEEILGGLVRAAQACYDFSKIFNVPFISGKDSLNNTWRDQKGEVLSIPGTLLISAIAIVEDVRKCVTMDFKKSGNLIFLLGETKEELGGSMLYDLLRLKGGEVPKVNGKGAYAMMQSLQKAIQAGLVQSCHDLSEGGLGVALSEMCIGGSLGAEIQLPSDLNFSDVAFLYSESSSRWLIEVEPKYLNRLKKIFSSAPFTLLGKVKNELTLKIFSHKKRIVNLGVLEMEKIWNSFSEKQ